METNVSYDVIIIGGGPGGSTCAYALKDSGLKVAIIDKAEFPRDKICGDAIPGPTHKVLKKVFGKDLFENYNSQQVITSTKLYYKDKQALNVDWVTKAINVSRERFDDVLFQELKNTSVSIYENTHIRKVERTENGIRIHSSKGQTFEAKLVIGADGANSVVNRDLGHNQKSDIFYGLRKYYSGVQLDEKSNHFFFKNKFPGYFWIFPVGDDVYNVGIGTPLNSKEFNIKEEFEGFLSDNPVLSKAFQTARPLEKTKGHKLPMGGISKIFSGNNYILLGDAASLVDPLWGHGIDKAIISGDIAAEEIKKAFKTKDFSASFFKVYNERIYKRIVKGQKKSRRVRNLLIDKFWLTKPVIWLLKKIDKRCS